MDGLDRIAEELLCPDEFLDLLRQDLPRLASKLERGSYEREWQFEIASMLLDAGFRAYTEYPHKFDDKRPKQFDIGITKLDDCKVPTHVIELKTILADTAYLPRRNRSRGASTVNLAKVATDFSIDIDKLRKCGQRNAHHWFLVVCWTIDKSIDSRLEPSISKQAESAPEARQRVIDGELWALMLWCIGDAP